jgi:hypothetical protein
MQCIYQHLFDIKMLPDTCIIKASEATSNLCNFPVNLLRRLPVFFANTYRGCELGHTDNVKLICDLRAEMCKLTGESWNLIRQVEVALPIRRIFDRLPRAARLNKYDNFDRRRLIDA